MKHMTMARSVTPQGIVRRPVAPVLTRTIGSAAMLRRADSDDGDESPAAMLRRADSDDGDESPAAKKRDDEAAADRSDDKDDDDSDSDNGK